MMDQWEFVCINFVVIISITIIIIFAIFNIIIIIG